MEKIDPSPGRQPADLPRRGRPEGHVRLHGARRRRRQAVRRRLVRCHRWLSPRRRRRAGRRTRSTGLRLRSLTKEFATFTAVKSLDLDVPAGSFFALLGPSGLRQDHDAADGRRARDARRRARSRSATSDITYDKPYRRPVNTVFQSYALFPHLDIFENVAFGLRRRKSQGRRQAGREMLDLVELEQPGAQEAGPALRRPAAARRAGPGADQPARGAAARRAARRPRPQAPPVDADRAQADPDRGRADVRARHPRPGGGHDDGRHHRGDERRA